MKHEKLLFDEEACKKLSQEERDRVMTDIILYLESLDSDDYSFHGKNEYGYQMSIAESRGYGFSIDLCWDERSLWCYRDSGFVHPNLIEVYDETYKSCMSKIRGISLKWCGTNFLNDH